MYVVAFRLADFIHCFFCVSSGSNIPNALLVVCVGKVLLTFSHIILNLIFNCLFCCELFCWFDDRTGLSIGHAGMPAGFWSCFCDCLAKISLAIFHLQFLKLLCFCVVKGVVVAVALGSHNHACAMTKLSLFVCSFR